MGDINSIFGHYGYDHWGRSISTDLPDRYQVKNPLISGEVQDLANGIVVKRTNRYGAESQSRGLQTGVLGGVANLDVDVTDSAGAILLFCAGVDGGKYNDRCAIAHTILSQRGRGQGGPFVAVGAFDYSMVLWPVMIHARIE